MATLIPQGLAITIPISLLLGVLMGLGRLSSDRETVAFQACGVSVFRMLYPLLFLAVVTSLATCYVLVVAIPDANQAFSRDYISDGRRPDRGRSQAARVLR